MTAVSAARRLVALAVPVVLCSVSLAALGPAVPAVAATSRLTVTQRVDPATFDHAGQVLRWTSVVRNSGDTTLSRLAVVDASSRVSVRTCAPVPLGGTLVAGASTTCTATLTVRQDDLDQNATRTDAVTASATVSASGSTVRASATAGATVQLSAGLSLSATVTPAGVSRVGQRVAYAVVARNRGNQTLHDLLVTAPLAGLSALDCAPVALGGSLAPGATTTCRASRTTTVADLAGRSVAGTARAGARTKTRAVNAAVPLELAARALPPVATDDAASVVDGGAPVVLEGSHDDRPGEPGGPAIDPSRTELVYGGRAYQELDLPSGTWTVRPDGRVQLTPQHDGLPVVSGSVGYRAHDLAGRSATGTLRVTILKVAAAVTDETSVVQGTPTTIDVLGNDDPGGAAGGNVATFDPRSVSVSYGSTSVHAGAGTLTRPFVGTFVVTGDGKVRFTPLPTFRGEATVGYRATSSNTSTVSGSLRVRIRPVNPQTNGPERRTTTAGREVTFPAARDDSAGATLVPSATLLVGAGGDTDSVRTAAGTWRVQADGSVVVDPSQGFSGTGSVAYAAVDRNGTRAQATLTLTVRRGPSAFPPLKATTPVGRPVSFDPLAKGTPGLRLDGSPARFVLASLGLAGPVEGSPGVLSDDGRTLTVPGVGVWTVAAATGAVRFRPEAAFTGQSSVSYSVQDDTGSGSLRAGRLSVAVVGTAPVATDDFVRTAKDTPVRLEGATDDAAGSAPLNRGATVFTADGQPGGSTRSADGKRLAVPGEGTWSLAADGSASFAPVPDFDFTTSAVGYQVVDTTGAVARAALLVFVAPGLGPRPDEVALGLGAGNVATVPVTTDDLPGQSADTTLGSVDATSVELPTGGQAAGWTVRSSTLAQYALDGTVVNALVDPTTGVVTFYRVSATASTRLLLRYTVRGTVVDATGATVRQTADSVVLVDLRVSPPPTGTDDRATTMAPYAVDLPASSDDVPGDPSVPISTTALGTTFPADQLPDLPPGSVIDTVRYAPTIVVTVPGEGQWVRRLPFQGVVTFTPEAGFVGTTTPLRYQVSDVQARTDQGILQVTVLPHPAGTDDTASTPQGVATTVDVLADDDPGRNDDGTRAVMDGTLSTFAGDGLPPGAEVTADGRQLTVPGQGRYTIQRVTGGVTFVPAAGFTGTATTVGLIVHARVRIQVPRDEPSRTRLTVTVVPAVPTARADTASASAGHPVVVPVTGNDRPGVPAVPLVGASVRLRTAPGLLTGSVLSGDAKRLDVPGSGVFLVAGNGEVTFVPLGTRTGTVSVGYSVADTNGTTARSTLAVTVR